MIQQRLFGMVHAYNKGELKKGDVDADLYSKIKKIANGMTDKDTKKQKLHLDQRACVTIV